MFSVVTRSSDTTLSLARKLWQHQSRSPWLGRSISSSSVSARKMGVPPETPTTEQLRIVALRYSIPMVGFGFMDNLVMISAGEAIDQTFGVTLGITTMAAAGFGQCFSDVAGNLSGGLVEAACLRLNLPTHGLTEDQLNLKISRVYRTLGACVGVVTGCLLGMSCLLFMDTEATDRARKAKQLDLVFQHVLRDGKNMFRAERASLFMLDKKKHELWSQVATGKDGIIAIKADSGIIGACVHSGELVNVANAYEDKRFNASVDKESDFRTKSVLAMPVKDDKGAIVGAIQMINKKSVDGSDSTFTRHDENLVRMMASHVTSFIQIVNA